MATHPSHELLWLSCAAKRCCSVRTVRPTGGDIWRIATSLDVPPESFLRTIPAEPSADDSLLLAPDGPPLHLALARRPVKGRQATCVFLMQIRDDVARCGLGALRPLPCRTFPATGADGVLCVSEQHGCTCRAWSLADLDRPVVAPLLEQEAAERALDRRLIQAWNQRVASAASLAEFCRYLMQAYADHGADVVGRGAP
jgi:Fe-S-cluster containining protein